MLDRFFYPGILQTPSLTLDGPEAHHLLHVLRAKPGDHIEVFNGTGDTATAIVETIRKRDVLLAVESTASESRPSGPILLTAVPKGDRFRWLVEKAVELGVERIVPLVTDRSSVIPRDAKLEKMEQTVVAACKQSRRNWLMPIDPPQAFATALRANPERPTLLADPTGRPLAELETDKNSAPPVFVVGPEGGFTTAEIEAALSCGALAVSLGASILRLETASIGLAAWWRLSQMQR